MDLEKKVLIGIDLNFETSFILAQAASFFRQNSAKFYILHVILPDIVPFINQNSKLKLKTGTADNRFKNVSNEIENELKKEGLYYLNYEIFVSYGFPPQEIINFSKKEGIDLIAIGTHQKIGIKELISGSISFTVAKNSICPVLLIPLKKTVKLSKKELIEENEVAQSQSAVLSPNP